MFLPHFYLQYDIYLKQFYILKLLHRQNTESDILFDDDSSMSGSTGSTRQSHNSFDLTDDFDNDNSRRFSKGLNMLQLHQPPFTVLDSNEYECQFGCLGQLLEFHEAKGESAIHVPIIKLFTNIIL